MANNTETKILTAAGKALLAQVNADESPLTIDKLIFANIPNLSGFPQPEDGVPANYVVFEKAVEQRGRLSADAVIYSTTLKSDEGPFDFNWTGAYSTEHGVLVTIDHHKLTPKTADEPGIAGNTLVRSVVLEYKDIAEITNISVDASTWQYNAAKRLQRMDDDSAQAMIDINGKDWFIDDGFRVTPQSTAFNIKAGIGYVAGNRVHLEFDRFVQVAERPAFIYVDAYRQGTATGAWETKFEFVITPDELDDYTNPQGIRHVVCKIAQVFDDGSISDLRPDGHGAGKNWTTQHFAKVVRNVDQLQQLSGAAEGQQVELLGYYHEGDGGGGSLIWMTQPGRDADGATVFHAGSPSGYWVRRNQTITPLQAGWQPDKSGPGRLRDLLNAGVQFVKPGRLTSLQGQAAKWAAGLKAPVGFYGDSTTDGRVTTVDGVNLAFRWNTNRLVGSQVPDDLTYDHDDTEVPNAYPNVLQRILRAFHDNDQLRVYNAGFKGKQAQDGWAVNNVHNAVYGNPVYSDIEWLGVMFGLNDSNADDSPAALERRTYVENQALILDAFARGVQPALLSCPPSNNTAQSGDYGNNTEVSELVDQVKRRMAHEYGIEFIDVNQAIKHWIYNNGDKLAFSSVSTDGLHLNDLGHLKKAEFLFKTAERDNVPTLDSQRHCFDVVHSAVRYRLGRNDISSSDPNRGANKLYLNGVIEADDVAKVQGLDVIDLWVWNEQRDVSLIYRAYKDAGVHFAEADRADLPRMLVESQLFTASDFHRQVIFEDVSPECIGHTGSGRTDLPCFVGKLKYGLNRVRIQIPETASRLFDNEVVTTFLKIGWLDFIADRQENRYPVMHYNTGFSYMDKAHWRDVVAGRGRVVHPPIDTGVPYNYVRNIVSPSLRGYNNYSLQRPGDVVEFRFEANFPSGTGVVLSWNKRDDFGDDSEVYDKKVMYSSGGILVMYASTAEEPAVRFVFLSPANQGIPSVPLIETGVAASDIQNKTMLVQLKLLSDYTIQVTLLSAELTPLYEGIIDDPLVVGEIATAYCGGSFGTGSFAGGTFELEYLQLREYSE